VSREKFVVVVVFRGGGAGGDGTFSHPRAGGRALSPIDPCQGRFKAERWPILQLLRGRFFTLLSLLLGRPCPAADRQWTFHAIAPRSLSPLLRRVHRGLGITVRKKRAVRHVAAVISRPGVFNSADLGKVDGERFFPGGRAGNRGGLLGRRGSARTGRDADLKLNVRTRQEKPAANRSTDVVRRQRTRRQFRLGETSNHFSACHTGYL
jgi:hypothetical protein